MTCVISPSHSPKQGTGKTSIIRQHLSSLHEDMLTSLINLNYYTTSSTLQLHLETFLEKRSGKVFGPSGNKHMITFIDDLNSPFVETYGTQTPIELLRQLLDYSSWYDRNDLSLKKEIVDVQLIAAMNHKVRFLLLSSSFFLSFFCFNFKYSLVLWRNIKKIHPFFTLFIYSI